MRKVIIVLAGLLLGTILIFQSSVYSDEQKPTEKGSMMEMKEMHKHCEQAMTVLDKVNTDIDQAHKQNDVNSLHNSLTEIQKSVKETREHLNACMSMHKQGEEHKH